MSATTEGHAAEMDRMYRVQRHVYDVTRRYYLLGRDQLIRDLRVPPGGTVLEVGCGTGRNLVKAAEAYPTAEIYGFDISAEMLKSANAVVARNVARDRFRVAQADALQFDPMRVFGVRGFDRIFFSYTVSMIPQWEGALSRACGHLNDGGELHIADFGRCGGLPQSFRTVLFWWLGMFGVFPRSSLRTEVLQLVSRNGEASSFREAYRGYSWHLVIRRLGDEGAAGDHHALE